MTDLHKAKCPSGVGQIVKTILKTAAEIIAAVNSFLTPDRVVFMAGFDVALMATVVLKGGIA